MISLTPNPPLEAETEQGMAKDIPALVQQVKKIIRAEQERHNIAEKYIRVESRNGFVQVPRTSVYLPTERESVWIVGTDDHVFKDFIEGPLSRLHTALMKDERLPCVNAQIPLFRGGPKSAGYGLTRLGRHIVECCRQYHEDWGVAHVNHVFRPAITVMLRAMRRYATRIGQEAIGSNRTTHSPELARLLHKLTRFVRRACGSWKFINAENDYGKQAQDNFDSAREFIYHLAGKHSRLLIIRIDLYYQPYYESEKANREINNFLRWLRSKACKRNLLPGYCGFIIKRENGIVRGTHWHLMVICDGNLQRNAGYLTRMIGEAWAKRTSQGRGSYHNCYADRAKYEFDGLGLLNLDDWERMAGLRVALHYMTKQDCVLKASNDKVKNFWRSTMRVWPGKKRGKPRLQDDSLKLLRRMLGGKRSKYPPGFDSPHWNGSSWSKERYQRAVRPQQVVLPPVDSRNTGCGVQDS